MGKLIWKRTGRTVSKEGTTVIYHASGTDYTIESRKRHIPHSNGRPGTWDYTSYWVLKAGKEVVLKNSLAGAKEYAEKLMSEEV